MWTVSLEVGGLRVCVSHKWESSFAGDRTFLRCRECGETFWIKSEERACPKSHRIEEDTLQM